MKPRAAAGHVRIIAGRWRGRRIRFPSKKSLRPTPDRVRETLFNWLSGELPGAYCLDCFAGTGVLGFEALSRGAHHVMAIESDKLIMKALRDNAVTLHAAEVMTLLGGPFPRALATQESDTRFDIVFIDPPFHRNAVPAAAAWLTEHQMLNTPAWIYVEMERNGVFSPPPLWQLHRQTTCGEGKALLFKFNSEGACHE